MVNLIKHFTLVNYCNMGYFQVRYGSRVVIYERKMFIRLATVRNDYIDIGAQRRVVNYDRKELS